MRIEKLASGGSDVVLKVVPPLSSSDEKWLADEVVRLAGQESLIVLDLLDLPYFGEDVISALINARRRLYESNPVAMIDLVVLPEAHAKLRMVKLDDQKGL